MPTIDPSKTYRTAGGHPVNILRTDGPDPLNPIQGEFSHPPIGWIPMSWSPEGRCGVPDLCLIPLDEIVRIKKYTSDRFKITSWFYPDRLVGDFMASIVTILGPCGFRKITVTPGYLFDGKEVGSKEIANFGFLHAEVEILPEKREEETTLIQLTPPDLLPDLAKALSGD